MNIFLTRANRLSRPQAYVPCLSFCRVPMRASQAMPSPPTACWTQPLPLGLLHAGHACMPHLEPCLPANSHLTPSRSSAHPHHSVTAARALPFTDTAYAPVPTRFARAVTEVWTELPRRMVPPMTISHSPTPFMEDKATPLPVSHVSRGLPCGQACSHGWPSMSRRQSRALVSPRVLSRYGCPACASTPRGDAANPAPDVARLSNHEPPLIDSFRDCGCLLRATRVWS